MLNTIDQPISLDQVIGFLVATPFFDGLDPFERAEVVRIMEVQRLQDGELVFKEGAPGDAWYVVFEGEVSVFRTTADGEVELARTKAGGCFGEMAILDGMPRSAGVKAAGPVTLFRFRRKRFDELLGQGSLGAYKLVAAMARLLSHRHRELTQQLSELKAASAAERYKVSE